MSAPVPYDERLHAPVLWWVISLVMVASLWVAVAVAAPALVAALVALVAVAVVVLTLLAVGSLRIRVEDGTLSVGRAHIDAAHLGSATALDAAQARHLAGPGADARAFLALRPYVATAVRIDLVDPADPAPYWLVATRHPTELAAAVALMRSSASG